MLHDKKSMIEPRNEVLTIKKQCELLDLNRSSYYSKKKTSKSPFITEQPLLDEILSIYTKYPFMGSRRIKNELNKNNFIISRKKVQSLMKLLNIKAIYPGPNLSEANKNHKKYPYLLRGMDIIKPNQVWSTDITYIRTKHGFMYLTAVIDVYSRYIVSWELSNSLSKDLCIRVMENALECSKPEIVNTDQGSQYTSNDFLDVLLKQGIQVSMDSKGRALDNIWIERFWRTVKYEEIHLKEYKSTIELYNGIKDYIEFYNNERGHQTFNYKMPFEMYFNPKNRFTKIA